jgi:hypothetical protein
VANTGDLFVNFKVNADGLQSGFAALNGFVGKSKRDLAAMDGAVNALSSTLAKLGIDPSFIFQMRDLVQIGTKQIPKLVEGIAALERQAGKLSGLTAPAIQIPAVPAPPTDALALMRKSFAEAVQELEPIQLPKIEGGAITAALGKIRDFAGTIPPRFAALRDSMSSAFSSGATAATGALSKIGPAISSLPTIASTAFGRIKSAFQGLPSTSSGAFEAIKNGALKFDATLTGVAARAATAGRAIGAALYTALGPIGLIIAGMAGLYAIMEKFVSDAEARVAESNARIEASMSRTKAAIDEVLGSLKNIRAERERTEAKSEGIEADIKGLQALLNARGDGIRFTEEQIARERDLRDEIAANAAAQKTLADASRDRAKAEETVRKAEQGLRDAEMSLNLGEIEESKFNELEANLKQQYAIQSAMRAQEEEAKKLAESTSQSLALEQQRLDLVSKVAEQRRREAEAEAQKQAVASILQGIEDERLRLTLSAADYEEMILDRRIKQAGIEDPQVIARIKAAQDALNLAKQQAEAEKVAKAAAGEKNTIAQETIRITEEARALQSAIDSIANEQAALEREMLELTMGKAAAEEHILRMKAAAAGLDAAATNDLIEQLKAVQDLRDAVAERKRTEAEQNRLLDERTRLEASIADATEAARAKAMEDDLRRQQMTETVSTAIGGLKIAATSDAIDIDKRIFDETKKQTDELKKINAALSAGGVAVLT